MALSDAGAIGIDIEVHRPHRNFNGIAAAAFGPHEQWLVAADGAAGFYRIWTLKEAMAKASGEGIAKVADRIDRVANGPKEGVWRVSISATPWLLAHTTPVPGLSLAVAIRGLIRQDSTLWNAKTSGGMQGVPAEARAPI